MIDKKYIITEDDITKVLRFVLDADCDSFDDWVTDVRHRLTPLSAHEATIAAKVREEVLDKLFDKIYCAFHAYQTPIDGRQIIDDCRKIIESLRSNPQEREGE
jgi:DNA-binding SARP family transcriptional activator